MTYNNLSKIESLKDFSGIVLVQDKGETVFCYEGGYAHKGFKVKNTRNTGFRIASVSKMFTAAAILTLVDSGKLDLDIPIHNILDLKDTKIPTDVTVHHLLTHTSGIADYYDESTGDEGWEKLWEEKPIYTVRAMADFLKLFADDEPVSPVGEKYYYNSAGYILLGMVIEKLSEQSYFDYVTEHVLKPLNMVHTHFAHLDHVCDNVAEGYECFDGKWVKNIYTALPGPSADGGATSTADDLLLFMNGLLEGKILSHTARELLLKPHVLDEGADGVRGYKWMYGYANCMILDPKTEEIIRGGHTGEEYGVSSRLYYYPEGNITITILGNVGFTAGKLGWDIHEWMMENRD